MTIFSTNHMTPLLQLLMLAMNGEKLIYLLIFINKFSFYASAFFFEISFSGKKLTVGIYMP